MKNTLLALVFTLSMIISWLLFSILWNFLDVNHTYIEVLRHNAQMGGLLILYWWFPGVIIIDDMLKLNYFR